MSNPNAQPPKNPAQVKAAQPAVNNALGASLSGIFLKATTFRGAGLQTSNAASHYCSNQLSI